MKHVFVLVIFEGKHYKKKKKKVGPFLCRIFLGREGDWTFQPRHLIFVLFFFLILSEWVLLSIALPDFQWKHCTPSLSLKSSMWEECKTWIPPPPLYTHFFFFYDGEWFYERNHFLLLFLFVCFLRHNSPSEIVLCRLYPQSPAFLVLPTMHTCLLCPLVS